MTKTSSPDPVLVVDDDEGLRLLLVDTLRQHGYGTVGAASGREALAALKRQPVALMLLDLKLADLSGEEILERLKRENLAVPFVVVTGQGNEGVAVEMMKRGALDYVMKDTSILDLLPAVVERALKSVERDQSLAAANAERARLEREVLAITEGERQRIRAELHDGVGQQLTAIELMCVGLKGDLAQVQPQLGAQVDGIAAMLRRAIAETRAIAKGLAPLDEAPDALQIGLAELAAQTEATGKLKCRFESRAGRPVMDRAVAGHFYRIAQEAVHNALRHSGARRILIRWEEADGRHRLLVEDDGRGLLDGSGKGQGLGLMRYRAHMIGGELTLAPRRGGGLAVTCTSPLPP